MTTSKGVELRPIRAALQSNVRLAAHIARCGGQRFWSARRSTTVVTAVSTGTPRLCLSRACVCMARFGTWTMRSSLDRVPCHNERFVRNSSSFKFGMRATLLSIAGALLAACESASVVDAPRYGYVACPPSCIGVVTTPVAFFPQVSLC